MKPLRPEAFRFLPSIAPENGPVHIDGPARGTLADAVSIALPALGKAQRSCVRVTVGQHVVPAERWALVRPKSWALVTIEVRPGANFVRTLLFVLVAAAAVAASAGLATPLLGAIGIGSTLSIGGMTLSTGALLGGVISIGGSLLINALVPAAKADNSSAPPVYAISGFQNSPSPNQPIPLVLGFPRIAPQMATLPRWVIVGDEQWTQVQMLCGYGPLDLSDDRIGRTEIAKYIGLAPEYRYGYADDAPLTIGADQCLEDRDNPLDITFAAGPQSRYTARYCSRFEVEVYFPSGLYILTERGAKQLSYLIIQIRWRMVGTSIWDSTLVVVTSPILTARDRPFFRAFPIDPGDTGEFEVEVSRTSFDVDDLEAYVTGNTKYFSRFTWSSLRSFRPDAPTNYPVPCAVIAMSLKATGQLSGTIQQYNILAKSIVRDWDHTTGTWVVRASNNPASLALHARTGPHCPHPRTDDQIDWAAFQDWHDKNRIRGLGYNFHHTEVELADEAVARVYAAGRAIEIEVDGKLSVAIDEAQTEFWDHISPRNSWGFSVKDDPVIFPEGIRATFRDETNLGEQAEVLVPWPTYEGDADDIVLTEDWSDDFRGVTNPDQLRIAIRRRQLEAIHRPRSYSVTQDFEHLACDVPMRAAYLNHYVLNRKQRAGRVTSVVGSTVSIDEVVLVEDGASYGARFRLANGRSVITTVVAAPGETRSFHVGINNPGDMPAVGDLVMFGELGSETIEVVVKEVQRGPNQSGTLVLVDHAPQIDALLATYTPPPWDPRAGHEVSVPDVTPLAPQVLDIESGRAASGAATIAIPYPVVVTLQPAVGERASLDSYVVSHRLVGAPTWATVTVAVSAGAAVFGGYVRGNAIEVRAHAVSVRGAVGPDSAISTHTVAASDPPAPNAPTALAVSAAGSDVTVTWTQSSTANAIAVQVYRATGAAASFGSALAIGDPVSGGQNSAGVYHDNGLAADDYRYWVVALDDNTPPVTSLPAGPADITI